MSNRQTISDLAYHLWRARGSPGGSPEIDWLEAERQVSGHLATPPPAEAAPTAEPSTPPGGEGSGAKPDSAKRSSRGRAGKAAKTPSPKTQP